MRSDTYITVSPEDPVAMIPKAVGKVRVIQVFDDNAIVLVIRSDKKEPVKLDDLVIKRASTAITGR